jgi:propionyl-CoA carboxylase alpha chain
MQHPRWRSGKISTGFIKEEYPGGFAARIPQGQDLETLAMVAAVIDHQSNSRRREISQQMSGDAVRFAQRRVVKMAGTEVRMEVSGGKDEPFHVVPLDAKGTRGQPIEIVTTWWPGEAIWTGRIGDRALSVQVRPILNGFALAWRGISVGAHVYTEREAALAALMPEKVAADTSKLLLCPMPGLVKAINVAAGEEVKAGDALAVVEAMKMENILRAERDAVVKVVNAKPGDSLAVDAVIMEFA